MLKCRLCPPSTPPRKSLSDLKYHVGLDHQRAAMLGCVVESGEHWRCSLCNYRLALTTAQPGGQPRELDPGVTSRHVSVVHNYIGHVYMTRTPAVPQARNYDTYRCELCPSFVTGHQTAFFSHLARCHVQQQFTAEMRACPSCHLEFAHVSDLVLHLCSTQWTNCNLALFFYYSQVDARRGIQHVRRAWPDYLHRLRQSCRTAVPESQQPPLPPVQIYPSAFGPKESVPLGSDFIEDPLSSSVRLHYDLYSNSVSVQFEKNLPMKSFRPQTAFGHSSGGGSSRRFPADGSCFFCELLDKPILTGGESSDSRQVADRLLIHLAEEHFASQLERMLGNPHREGHFRQGERVTYISYAK